MRGPCSLCVQGPRSFCRAFQRVQNPHGGGGAVLSHERARTLPSIALWSPCARACSALPGLLACCAGRAREAKGLSPARGAGGFGRRRSSRYPARRPVEGKAWMSRALTRDSKGRSPGMKIRSRTNVSISSIKCFIFFIQLLEIE